MTGMTPHSLLNPDLPMLLLELLIIQVGMGIGSMEHLNRLFAVPLGDVALTSIHHRRNAIVHRHSRTTLPGTFA